MKLLHRLFICLAAIPLLLLVACEKDSLKPVDDFYRFDKLEKLTLKKQAKRDFIIGYDNELVGLEVTAYEHGEKIVGTPQTAVSFYANNTQLEGEIFTPRTAGTFKLYGKLAGVTSDTMTIRVWDPATLSLRLTVSNEPSDIFYSDGVDTVGFKVELLGDQKVLPVKFAYSLTANGNTFDQTFTTNTPGAYKFVAKAVGLKSNEINVQAVPAAYAIVRLPVVFHEINTRDLTAAYIRQLTDAMTKAYRNQFNATGGPKDPNAKDLFVEFYPAQTGLNGTKLQTPGLDRVTSTKTSFTAEDAFNEAANHFWDPERVLNIWVIPNITGDYAYSSWAYLPSVTKAMAGFDVEDKGTEPFLPYGVFLNKIMTGTNRDGNRTEETLIHEVGHMLGLRHVFDGNGSNHNPCSEGDPDYCFDTPYYDRNIYSANYSSQNVSEWYKRTSCSGNSYTATNYMDYYLCYNNSFTNEQLKRVRHTINYGLWLPTPFNGYGAARTGNIGRVEKPANLVYVKPVICK